MTGARGALCKQTTEQNVLNETYSTTCRSLRPNASSAEVCSLSGHSSPGLEGMA